MLRKIKNIAREYLRPIVRAGDYPILLPHHRLIDGAVHSLGQPARAVDAALARALELCDGKHRLSQIVAESGTLRKNLLAESDRGTIILWPVSVEDAPTRLAEPPPIILSPHLDDAVLSLGMRMLAMGEYSHPPTSGPGTVLTVFSNSSWSRFPDVIPAEVRTIRAAEEKLAVGLAGWRPRFLDLPEALHRGHSLSTIFTEERRDEDRSMLGTVKQQIVEFYRAQRTADWFLPLGTGKHVDHLIVREAALAALNELGHSPASIRFYEELPYAAEFDPPGDFSGTLKDLTLEAETPAGLRSLRRKTEMLRVYWSQLTPSQIAQVWKYAHKAGGERVWKFKPGTIVDKATSSPAPAART